MLPVDEMMSVMCHVLFACRMLVQGSWSWCHYFMFSRSVDTCRSPGIPSCMATSSLCGIPLSLSLWELSYNMSPSWIDRRHVLRSVAVSCHCVVEMFDCLTCLWASPSSAEVGARPTVLVPVVSSPNNNCFGTRSSDMHATWPAHDHIYHVKVIINSVIVFAAVFISPLQMCCKCNRGWYW